MGKETRNGSWRRKREETERRGIGWKKARQKRGEKKEEKNTKEKREKGKWKGREKGEREKKEKKF